MRIYLAGPAVFLPNAAEVGRKLKSMCAAHGMEGVFPLDGDGGLKPVRNPDDIAQNIYRTNISLIQSCQAVVADMTPFRGPSMDPGTAFEMGYAAALGKPVIGFTLEEGDYLDRVLTYYRGNLSVSGNQWFDPDGLEVENFGLPDNLMMCGSCSVITQGIDQALIAARSILRRPLETELA
ncbi:MAG: nucleoside 2-deoxyribosyltransferase [Rhodospirillaceae bacterium]